MGAIPREKLFADVRAFVNRLAEKEFDELRKAASEGWKSLSHSSDGVPSMESLKDFVSVVKRLEDEYRCRLPKGATEHDNHGIAYAVFLAVNERYLADVPPLDPVD